MIEAYEKVKKVILSCEKKEEMKMAKRMVFLFHAKFKSHYYDLILQDTLNHKEDEFVWF